MKNLVQSVDRALEILDILATEPDGLRLMDLAERLGLPPSTVHALVRTLQQRSYVERLTRPIRYTLGPTAEALSRVAGNDELVSHARQEADTLDHKYSDGSFAFSELRGDAMVKVFSTSRPGAGNVTSAQGRLQSPYATPAGLLSLAFADAGERAAIERMSPFWQRGAALWETPEQLDRFLEHVVRRGYAAGQMKRESVFRVGAPVFADGRLLIGALTGLVPAEGTAPRVLRDFTRDLVAAAERLSD